MSVVLSVAASYVCKIKGCFPVEQKIHCSSKIALIAHANEMNAPRCQVERAHRDAHVSPAVLIYSTCSRNIWELVEAGVLIFGGNTVHFLSVQVVNDSHESATI